MAIERTQFGGLNTDAARDQMGNAAFNLLNVIPKSADTVTARPGVSLEVTDLPAMLGRQILEDGLPENEGEGVLLTCEQGTDPGTGVVATQVDWNAPFYPPEVQSDLATASGYSAANLAYGIAF